MVWRCRTGHESDLFTNSLIIALVDGERRGAANYFSSRRNFPRGVPACTAATREGKRLRRHVSSCRPPVLPPLLSAAAACPVLLLKRECAPDLPAHPSPWGKTGTRRSRTKVRRLTACPGPAGWRGPGVWGQWCHRRGTAIVPARHQHHPVLQGRGSSPRWVNIGVDAVWQPLPP